MQMNLTDADGSRSDAGGQSC